MKQSSLLSGDTHRSPRALMVLLGLAVVVSVLASCTVSAAQQKAAPTAAAPVVVPTTAAPTVDPTTAAPAAEVGTNPLPLGSYANPKAVNGSEALILEDAGQYSWSIPAANRLIKGTWKVTGNQMEFTETSGGECAGVRGTYNWALNGNALSFARVFDSCYQRAMELESGAWTRVPPLGSYANDKTGYGPLVLILADGGQFTLTAGGEKVLTQGTWKVTGDQIELTENSKGFCPNKPGTYKWALDGKALSFTMVHQSCALSVPFDSQAAWVRQP